MNKEGAFKGPHHIITQKEEMKMDRYIITKKDNKVEILDSVTNTMYRGRLENGKVIANSSINLSVITKVLRGGK
jgi:hypothetical protein